MFEQARLENAKPYKSYKRTFAVLTLLRKSQFLGRGLFIVLNYASSL